MSKKTQQSFKDLLYTRWAVGAYVCVGLDTDIERVPLSVVDVTSSMDRIVRFNKEIVNATSKYASAFKFNSAHYEKMGEPGFRALKLSVAYIKSAYPDIPVIVDAKRGDISETNRYYAEALFDTLEADAATVHPYMGRTSLLPFLNRKDKGVIVMGANTAEGSEEIQALIVQPENEPLYKVICRHVATDWNANDNCVVTAGATNTDQLQQIRDVVGDMPILLLGIGAQGGDLQKSITVGRARNNFGLIINASRSIIYASNDKNFAQAAGKAAGELNQLINHNIKLYG